MYTVKAIKIARMPVHLRWELYPGIYNQKNMGNSAYPESEREWQKRHAKTLRNGINQLLKENFKFSDYFKTNWTYWLALYPWHIGFIFIIAFHIMCFFGALALIAGIPVSADSSHIIGQIFYYVILVFGATSFITGVFGSIGLLIKRLIDRNLRIFAAPQNYFNYIFTLVVFFSGLYSWIFTDPTLSQYREFWKGLLMLNPVSVEPATAAHIIFFALFLIYLPFTRSMHYITKFFSFIWIRWDDRPGYAGSKIEKDVTGLLCGRVTWSAPHIKSGKTWAEIANEDKHDEKTS
jgi:nitrate reductase gamma subunit